MVDKNEIIYDCRWSDNLNPQFISDFIDVERKVFGSYEMSDFKNSFIDNIYGPSVLVVVYINGKPSAARALWRNDINGRESYQPGNTCVLEICRGKGIFSEMTRKSVAMLPHDAIIYNFPNPNSFPGYLKMGWKLVGDYHLVLLLSNSKYQEENPVDMDRKYAEWRVFNDKTIKYIKRGNCYYLIKPQGRRFCYRVISRVDETIARNFKRFKGFGLIFYKSLRTTFYNRRFAANHVVSKNPEVTSIPLWKIDAL